MRNLNFDHFIKSPNMQFTGLHLLVDMSGLVCSNIELVESLDKCLAHINATVLHKNIHNFDENDGISGCYTLAESHLSFHSWWEADGVLILDFFTCGDTNPLNALEIIKTTLHPKKANIRAIPRGSLYFGKNKGIHDVFVLIDPRNGLPFYVGRGTKTSLEMTLRCTGHREKDVYLREMYANNMQPIVHMVTTDTCEEMSLLIETYLIDFYGRQRDCGLLTNIHAVNKPDISEKMVDTLQKYHLLINSEVANIR